MAKFKAKRHDGITYELSHLDDRVISYDCGKAEITALVRYSCHCFTEELRNHPPGLFYNHKGEMRAFSIQRYRDSLNLPDYLEKLIEHVVYFTNRRNFLFVRSESGTYVVFFNVIKATNPAYDLIVNVQSAHRRSNFHIRAAPVRYSNLLLAIASGKTISPGPPQKIKRK